MKLLDINTLASGTEQQKKALGAIRSLGLFETLAAHSPVLAGTIPLDIDTPDSDLDVICSADNLEDFATLLRNHYGELEGFRLIHKMVRNQPTVVARFRSGGFQFEIFTQAASVFTQPAVIHMLTEARLLTFAPKEAKDMIRALKLQGTKTEPAFAQIFALEGDPFEELTRISRLPDHEILMITHRFRLMPQ